MAPSDDTPVTLDELADLQAGLLEPDEAERLRARVTRDPATAELLGALELIRAELVADPGEPVPDDVVTRLDLALTAEQQHPLGESDDTASGAPDWPAEPTASISPQPTDGADGDVPAAGDPPVLDLASARRRRRRGVVQGLGALAAAAALVSAVVVLRQPSGPVAGSVPAYGAADLASAWPEVAALRNLGPLEDPQMLRMCLSVGGTPLRDQDELLGARPVTLDGRAGVLVAYPAPPSASGPQVTLVVFDTGCGPDAVLAQTTVTR